MSYLLLGASRPLFLTSVVVVVVQVVVRKGICESRGLIGRGIEWVVGKGAMFGGSGDDPCLTRDYPCADSHMSHGTGHDLALHVATKAQLSRLRLASTKS